MKTLQDLLEQLVEKYNQYKNIDDADVVNHKIKQNLRDLIKTEEMFVGYYSDKLTQKCTDVSLCKDIDTMFANMTLTSGINSDRDTAQDYLVVKYFIGADDATKENIVKDSVLSNAVLKANQHFLRFIDPAWYSKLNEYNQRPCIWDALMCVQDFDNITDKEIIDVANSRNGNQNTSYSIACTLFGEDKVIPLIIKGLQENGKKSDEIISFRANEEEDLMQKILTGLDDESVKKYQPNSFHLSGYLRLCNMDQRYLIHANYFLTDEANNIWEQQDEYTDIIRYCGIIAKCCGNRNIPSYQLNKIKVFAPLIQMYMYNYQNVFNAIKDSFNADGSIKQEVLTLSKAKKQPKPEQTYYCVIKDGNIQIFKSEEERTNANIEGGINYDFNKVQLRKKMDELLGN